MKSAVTSVGAAIGAAILFPVAHWAVWALIPPLSPRSLAKRGHSKTGHFIAVDGIDTSCERYGSGPPLILIPPGGSHTSTWRFNNGALSRAHEAWSLELPGSGYGDRPATFPSTHRSDLTAAINKQAQVRFSTNGGVQVPCRIESDFSEGQYMRIRG